VAAQGVVRRLAGAPQPGKCGRLVYLLQRYGEAIEADLALAGWDLEELFRARRWRFILNIIDHLPGTSHFMAAVAGDEELAAQAPEPEPGPPPLQTWTPEVAALTLIADRMGELIAMVHNTAAKHPAQPPPRLPRPETGHDRLRAKRRRIKRRLLTRRLTAAAQSGRPAMDTAVADDLHTLPGPRAATPAP
jgi:hypothetical protein